MKEKDIPLQQKHYENAIYALRKNMKKARKYLNEAKKIYPDSLHLIAAEINISTDLNEAVKPYEEGKELLAKKKRNADGGSYGIFTYLIQLAARSGDIESARKYMKELWSYRWCKKKASNILPIIRAYAEAGKAEELLKFINSSEVKNCPDYYFQKTQSNIKNALLIAENRHQVNNQALKREVQVLFHLTSESSGGVTSFIEMKRPFYKGYKDFSKYCSWFEAKKEDGKIIAHPLTFESWDREIDERKFEEGVLRKNEFVRAGGEKVELQDADASKLGQEWIDACLDCWGDKEETVELKEYETPPAIDFYWAAAGKFPWGKVPMFTPKRRTEVAKEVKWEPNSSFSPKKKVWIDDVYSDEVRLAPLRPRDVPDISEVVSSILVGVEQKEDAEGKDRLAYEKEDPSELSSSNLHM